MCWPFYVYFIICGLLHAWSHILQSDSAGSAFVYSWWRNSYTEKLSSFREQVRELQNPCHGTLSLWPCDVWGRSEGEGWRGGMRQQEGGEGVKGKGETEWLTSRRSMLKVCLLAHHPKLLRSPFYPTWQIQCNQPCAHSARTHMQTTHTQT